MPIQSSLDEEEYYEVYVEPEPLPYPKAGNGLVLPPEEDDVAILIDEDVVSYSHAWKGRQGWEERGVMGWRPVAPPPLPPLHHMGMAGGGGVAIGVGA